MLAVFVLVSTCRMSSGFAPTKYQSWFLSRQAPRRQKLADVSTQLSRRQMSYLTPELDLLSNDLMSLPTDIAKAQMIVKLGDKWTHETTALKVSDSRPQPPLHRVIGCTAVVNVGVNLATKVKVGDETPRWCVEEVLGNADARMSRGLLALLALGFQGCDCADVLAVDAKELLKRSGLIRTLPPSRTNGLISMVKTIHKAINESLAALTTRGQLNSALKESHESAQRRSLGVDQEAWSGVHLKGEVAVLLSGGVDSSVALRLAQQVKGCDGVVVVATLSVTLTILC
jgi:sulfur transfer protein SufE